MRYTKQIMKKLLLFVLSAMAGMSAMQAQTFRPFCEEGKTWKSDSYMLTHPNPFSTWTVETWKMEDGKRESAATEGAAL